MTSQDLKYVQQVDFRYGINQFPEDAKPGQVIDALNIWAVNEVAEVRPGANGRLVMDPLAFPRTDIAGNLNIPYDQAGSFNALVVESAAGVRTPITQTAPTTTLGAVSVGGSIVMFFNATAATANTGGLFSVWIPMTTVNTNNTTYALEILTSTRGWVGVEVQGYPYLFGDTSKLSGGFYYQYFFFNAPKDAATNGAAYYGTSSAGAPGFLVRFRVMGVATSSGTAFHTNGIGPSNGPTPFIQNLSNQQVVNNGFYRLQYASGTKVLGISTSDYSTTLNPGIVATAPPYVTYSERNGLFYEPQINYTGGFAGQYNGDYSFLFAQKYRAYPPSVTVLPEFNTAFSAYQNTIVEHPFAATFPPTGTGQGPAYGAQVANPYWVSGATANAGPNGAANFVGANVAQVTTDQSLVGPSSIIPVPPYANDIVALDSQFPAANLIIYFKNRLFAAGIVGRPATIKWSGDAGVSGVASTGAYVWPSTSETTLSSAKDNSEITALASLGDNLVVFKKDSIWQLVLSGQDLSQGGIATFEAQLVVAGVGCLAHASVQPVMGKLMFLSEDGFYVYDGTPNIKRVSDPIRNTIEYINPGRAPFAQAVVWRSKAYYLCAVGVDGSSDSNNTVLAYDYQQDAWWIWSGWDVQCWFQNTGVGFREEIWYFDRYGRAYKLGWGSSDNGTPIQTTLTTQRFGQNDILTKDVREVRIRGQNNNGPVTFDVISDDITSLSGAAVTMPLMTEAQYQNTLSTAVTITQGTNLVNTGPAYGVAYAPDRRRERKHGTVGVTAKWFQLKIYNALKIIGIDFGYLPDSRR